MIMKTRVNIIAILSIVAIMANAQVITTSQTFGEPIQTQQLVSPVTSYEGELYEPFDNTAPSERTAVGAQYASSKGSGIKKGFDTGADAGQSDEFPIGDGVWAMLFCALAFAGVIALRRRVAKE